MWEFLDGVVYINLDKRTDRREHMEKMTKLLPNVHRFSAIEHNPGYIGASKSHIGALNLALEKGWKNVLILEDDAQWNEFEKGYAKLEALVSKDYDVIMLGSGRASYESSTSKLFSAQSGVGYLVNGHYIPTLLKTFEEGLEKLISTNDVYHYGLDMYWKNIQPHDNWFVIIPSLVYQIPSYSDIVKQYVEYTFI